MKLKLFTLFTLLLLIFGCSSDDSNTNNDDDNQDTVLIKQINYASVSDGNDVIYSESFVYDGNKLISVVDVDSESFEDYKSTFEYNNNNRFIRVDHYEGEELVEYTTLNYNSENVLSSFTTFLFDVDQENVAINNVLSYGEGNSTISLEQYRGDFTSQTELSGTINYTIENGNTVAKSSDINDDTENYIYDSKNSMYKNIFAIEIIVLIMDNSEYGFDIHGANNNVTEITDNQGVFFDVESFEYNYDTNDYPVNAIAYYNDEPDYNIEYIYE